MFDLATRWLGSQDQAPPPVIDLSTWRLEVFGTGLRGRPDAGHAVAFTYDDLLALPARTIRATLGCAAQWTGPLLYDVLELAGITFDAVSLLGEGLDEPGGRRGVGPTPVRGPLPMETALDDMLVAYAMNGQRLSPEQGFPARLIGPESAVDSVMWLGRIEVLSRPGGEWS